MTNGKSVYIRPLKGDMPAILASSIAASHFLCLQELFILSWQRNVLYGENREILLLQVLILISFVLYLPVPGQVVGDHVCSFNLCFLSSMFLQPWSKVWEWISNPAPHSWPITVSTLSKTACVAEKLISDIVEQPKTFA